MNFSTRPANIGDLEFVYFVMRVNMQDYFDRFTQEGWSREKFVSGFDPSRIAIIEAGNFPAGFYDVEFTDRFGYPCAYVHNVQISSEYRGLGQLVLRRIEDEARTRGVNRIRGKVFDDNKRAVLWAESNGYRKIGYQEEEHSFLLEKELL